MGSGHRVCSFFARVALDGPLAESRDAGPHAIWPGSYTTLLDATRIKPETVQCERSEILSRPVDEGVSGDLRFG